MRLVGSEVEVLRGSPPAYESSSSSLHEEEEEA